MKRILVIVRSLFRDRFNLDADKAEEEEIVLSIRKYVVFKGANLWTLIFAIFIASIGLNVNSTAVIIGAMLISPLMGPIMGIGLGIGINDLQLVKRGLMNLFIAAFFSIATSTLYFWLTPLHEAQSEILARTTPSLWDVFIAFFGGLAGIVATTRKEKTNVIPGVAIATALMPPLCTAGFGLANGYIYYFLGALYLFFINSVLICIAAFLIVRYLKFHRKQFEDKSLERKVSRIILVLVLITVIPSIYLAYILADKSIFETNARDFVSKEFRFTKTQVVDHSFVWQRKLKTINILLIGEELSQNTLDTIRNRMKQYSLDETKLIVRQGLNAGNKIDFAAIKASILQDVFNQADTIAAADLQPDPDGNITEEIKVLYPDAISYSIGETVFVSVDTLKQDTMKLAVFKFDKKQSEEHTEQLKAWLKNRLDADSLKLIVE